jgi:RimJ/RimL family protein N-acetyltransferase
MNVNAGNVVTLRPLDDSPANRVAVHAVFMACDDYTRLVEGRASSDADTDDFFAAVPPGYTLQDLFLFAIERGGDVVGVVGLLRGWNAPHKAHIGLLLLVPAARSGGVGAAAVQQIERIVHDWPATSVLRIAVVATNVNAFAFWRKMGFVETGEVKPQSPPYIADIVVLEKTLRSGKKT